VKNFPKFKKKSINSPNLKLRVQSIAFSGVQDISFSNIHLVRKKGATLFLPVTPRNSNRFSNSLPSRSAVNLQ